MKFKELNNKIRAQFSKMCATGMLFIAKVSGDEVWEEYINAFAPEDNKIFRDPASSEHNCNCCKNFIRRYGNIVAIIDNEIQTIFDINHDNDLEEYTNSILACDDLVKSAGIDNVFVETYDALNRLLNYESVNKHYTSYQLYASYQLGHSENRKQYTQEEVDKFGVVNTHDVYTFHHFNISLPREFVLFDGSKEAYLGKMRSNYDVFLRTMAEIPLDTLKLVQDLIKQGSLLDAESHLHAVQEIIQYKEELAAIEYSTDLWIWQKVYKLSERTAKFKNTLIGVLCTELAEGMELNKACENWNKRVDPVNYHKAKAPITESQRKLAEKFVIENGYLGSFNRRLATIDDIKASEIKFKNTDDSKPDSVTIFDSIYTSGTGKHKRSQFDGIETVHIDKFMTDILPGVTNIELLLENRMDANLVNLTTSDENSKQIFKWDNPFSYTFNGNLAGKSQIKEAVKSRGGKTDGCLRISLYFPDTIDDYDLHVYEPNRYHISFANLRQSSNSGGMLDLDAQGRDGKFPPEKRVENVIYSNKEKMLKGTYEIVVHNYSGRRFPAKFKIEIEDDKGEITVLELAETGKATQIHVADVIFNGETFTIKSKPGIYLISSETISKKIWGLDTNEFHRVSMMCLTPNHWGNNNVGNKYYLFMLQNCKNPNEVRGFHNEHLISELLQHRKVLDVLGDSATIPYNDNQLAGVGFNATVRDEVIVRLKGTHKRVIKVKF